MILQKNLHHRLPLKVIDMQAALHSVWQFKQLPNPRKFEAAVLSSRRRVLQSAKIIILIGSYFIRLSALRSFHRSEIGYHVVVRKKMGPLYRPDDAPC